MSQKSDICSLSDVCMERLSWLLSVQAGSEETGAAGYTPEMLLAAPHERVDRQGPAAQEDRQHRLLQARTPADARLQAGSAQITIPTVQEIGSTLHLLSYHSALAKAAHPLGQNRCSAAPGFCQCASDCMLQQCECYKYTTVSLSTMLSGILIRCLEMRCVWGVACVQAGAEYPRLSAAGARRGEL
jgi:hypothetical protein